MNEDPGNLLVNSCTRCGYDHHVYFKNLSTQILEQSYWGVCPVKNEPILMRFEEINSLKNIGDKE